MLAHYEDALEQWITRVVSNGDDDALFACGYLQGHVAVVLSQLEAQGKTDLDALVLNMTDSLVLARQELNDTDFAFVEQAWAQLHVRMAG